MIASTVWVALALSLPSVPTSSRPWREIVLPATKRIWFGPGSSGAVCDQMFRKPEVVAFVVVILTASARTPFGRLQTPAASIVWATLGIKGLPAGFDGVGRLSNSRHGVDMPLFRLWNSVGPLSARATCGTRL